MEKYFGFAKELLNKGYASEVDSYGEDNLYDINIDDTSDVDFYLKLANECKGNILDIGCGTGRILKPLLDAGHEGVGIDLSASMLKIAKEKLSKAGHEPNLLQGDMRDFQINEDFSLVVIPNCSMIYIDNDDDRKKVFKTAYQHLKKGGVFAFDFDAEIVPIEETKPWLSSQTLHPSTGELIVSTVQMNGINENLRLINMTNYQYKENNDCTITVNASFEATCVPEKIVELLQSEGFNVRGIYSDYHFTPYKSGELCVIVAEKY